MFQLDSTLIELVNKVSKEISSIDTCDEDLFFNRNKDVVFFKNDMVMSNMQLCCRWGNVEYDSHNLVDILWYSGEITFFKETHYRQKNEYNDETEIGFIKLPAKFMRNIIKSATAKVLISQVLFVEKKYKCLKQSALQEMNGKYTHESHIIYRNIANLKMERRQHEEQKKWLKEGIIESPLCSLKDEFEAQRDEIQEKFEVCKAQLATANARITELETQLVAQCKSLSTCDGKGLVKIVCRMRREGHTDSEIAAHLYDNSKWCSQSQVGALLHPDENKVASDSMTQRSRRLLGKA